MLHNNDNYTVSQKRILTLNDCNLQRDYQILIIFGTNIPDTTAHPVTVQVPISPSVCSCTTWGNQNKRNITFLFKVVDKITHIKHILSRFLSLADSLSSFPVFQLLTENIPNISPVCEHVHWQQCR